MTDGRFYVSWTDPYGQVQVSWLLPDRSEAEQLAARVECMGATDVRIHQDDD